MELWLIKPMVISLLLTILLELCFALAVRIRNRRDLLLLCLMNVITNPLVTLCYYLVDYYTEWKLIPVTLFLEGAAILAEGFYFKKYGKTFRNPFLFSVCVNSFSYAAGKIINLFI